MLGREGTIVDRRFQHRGIGFGALLGELNRFLDDALVTDLPRDYNGYVALMRRCLDQGGRFVAAAISFTSR